MHSGNTEKITSHCEEKDSVQECSQQIFTRVAHCPWQPRTDVGPGLLLSIKRFAGTFKIPTAISWHHELQTRTELHMSTAPLQQPEERPRKSLAPLWHTVLLLLLLFVVVTLFRTVSFQGMPHAYRFTLVVFADLVLVLFSLFGVHLNGNRLGNIFGLLPTNWREIAVSTLLGLAVGCASVLIALFLIINFGPFYRGDASHAAPQTLSALFLFFAASVSTGISEEFTFRGYLLKQIYSLNGNMMLALLLQGAIFALAHGLNQTPAGVTDKIAFSLLLGMVTIWRKSLVPAIVAHASSNAFAGLMAFISQ